MILSLQFEIQINHLEKGMKMEQLYRQYKLFFCPSFRVQPSELCNVKLNEPDIEQFAKISLELKEFS